MLLPWRLVKVALLALALSLAPAAVLFFGLRWVPRTPAQWLAALLAGPALYLAQSVLSRRRAQSGQPSRASPLLRVLALMLLAVAATVPLFWLAWLRGR